MTPPAPPTDLAPRLRDGTPVAIRPIEPADGPGLVRFHEALSDETSRRRFFNVHPHLTDAEVRRFTNVDHVDRQALVMVVDGDIIAVGRLDREPAARSAEVAFVVRDDWQGKGAAPLLLRELTEWARGMGVQHLEADTFTDNHAMLAVFRRTGTVVASHFELGVLHLTMDIRAPLDAADAAAGDATEVAPGDAAEVAPDNAPDDAPDDAREA